MNNKMWANLGFYCEFNLNFLKNNILKKKWRDRAGALV